MGSSGSVNRTVPLQVRCLGRRILNAGFVDMMVFCGFGVNSLKFRMRPDRFGTSSTRSQDPVLPMSTTHMAGCVMTICVVVSTSSRVQKWEIYTRHLFALAESDRTALVGNRGSRYRNPRFQ